DGGKRPDFLVGPAHRLVNQAVDLEVPFREINPGHGAVMEHGPLLGHRLARGDALLRFVRQLRTALEGVEHATTSGPGAGPNAGVARYCLAPRVTLTFCSLPARLKVSSISSPGWY